MDNSLNDKQKEAVEYFDSPLLVIAGAGSGKTKTLTYKIYFLIKELKYSPQNILAVTFTNKAANEMKTRINELLNENISLPFLGTFHSICVKILRSHGNILEIPNNFNIYDTSDSEKAILQAMEILRISPKSISVKSAKSFIQNCKNELTAPEDYPVYSNSASGLISIYNTYTEILKQSKALDFDDLLLKTVELLKYRDELEYFRNKFQYILVDEYQDTNVAQYTLIKMLVGDRNNIFCVGDPDQNIYSFRGANINNILNFEKDYKNCKVITLDQNYRSSKTILEASENIIKKNSQRKDKNMWTTNPNGNKIIHYCGLDEEDEANFVKDIVLKNYDKNDIAVLYRTNAQSRAIEEVLIRYAISYRLIGGLKFYDRKEIKDLLAFFKLIHNPYDTISFSRIINIPPRGIGAVTIKRIISNALNNQTDLVSALLNDKKLMSKEAIYNFSNSLKEWIENIKNNKTNLKDLLVDILYKTKYLEYIKKSEEEDFETRKENISELFTVINSYILGDDAANLLNKFIEDTALVENTSDNNLDEENNKPQVTLMSIHNAKGLEFHTVILTGLEEGLFPHSRSLNEPNDMEEERRLCYVAVTRAIKQLYITHTYVRNIYGQSTQNRKSRFIDDIPSNLIEEFKGKKAKKRESKYNNTKSTSTEEGFNDMTYMLKTGQRVNHEIYGAGNIIDFDKEIVLIDFDNYGKKKILISFADNLELLK